MVTKRIHKQQNWKIFEAVLYIAMAAFLAFLGIQVYKNGAGVSGNGPRTGLKAVFSSILRKLEEKGHPELLKWIMLVMVIAAVLYSLFKAVMVLIQNKPEYTELGQSVLRQAEPGENFKDLLQSIERDIEGGYKEFGGDVFISSSWILADDIMRLKRIKKIDTRKSTWMNYIVLEDVDGNSMEVAFVLEEHAEEAFAFLKGQLPLTEIAEEGVIVAGRADTGKMYSWHVPKTPDEIENYRKLARQGDAYAQTEYGKCILFGKGSGQDKAMAYKWFDKAAAQSDEIAKMYAGHCILYGIGVEKDEIKGYKILDAALNYNYPEESQSQPLADYSKFQPEDIIQLYWDLGDALEKGLGVVRNYQVAVYYFNMIEQNGYKEGAERMNHYQKGISGWKKI